MKFDTKGIRKKDYKNVDDYLAAVWERNKSKVIETDHEYSKENFINATKKQSELKGITLKKAMDVIGNSARFTPYYERARNNIIETMRNFKYSETESTFKHLTTMVRDSKGHFTKFDREKLQWSRENGAYIYAGKVLIDITNSPLEVKFKVL